MDSLKMIRLKKGYSQSEFSNLLCVSKRSIQNYEKLETPSFLVLSAYKSAPKNTKQKEKRRESRLKTELKRASTPFLKKSEKSL